MRTNHAEINCSLWPCVPKYLLNFNSSIMVGYATQNIHFRKSCAHFKIFHSVEILYCKLSPASVRVCACVCVCFQNSNNSQLHKRTESSGVHGNANDNLLRVGYQRRWLEFLPLLQTCWVHLECRR